MRIRGSKEQILYGIQVVQNVAGLESSQPILSNIILETKKENLELSTSDLEASAKCLIPINVEKEGGITVPVKLFSNIIKELPEKEVEIRVEEGNDVRIQCGKVSFNLFGLPVNEYPSLPKFQEKASFKVNANILKDMIKKTRFAVSMDEDRRALNGVLFNLKEKEFRMVSTDGHRLAYMKKPISHSSKEELGVIVSVKILNEILRTFPEEGKRVKVSIGKNQISFNLEENIQFTSRLLEGTFVNYEQAIPQKIEREVTINTRDLFHAVRRVSLLSEEKTGLLKFKITKDRLALSGTSHAYGEAREELGLELKGEEIELGFNAPYLLEILRVIDTEKFCWEITGIDRPSLIRPLTKEGKAEDYLCLLMPVRV